MSVQNEINVRQFIANTALVHCLREGLTFANTALHYLRERLIFANKALRFSFYEGY